MVSSPRSPGAGGAKPAPGVQPQAKPAHRSLAAVKEMDRFLRDHASGSSGPGQAKDETETTVDPAARLSAWPAKACPRRRDRSRTS